MTAILTAMMAVVLYATPLFAAGLDTPSLSAPLALTRFFDPDSLLVTNGGVRFSAADDLTLEPKWGVGYRAVEMYVPGGVKESSQLQAQAGWRLSLAKAFYLSAAAKLTVLTYESASRHTGQELGARYDYDFVRAFRNPLSWTGEIGVRLSRWADLNLFYDKNPISGWLSEQSRQEELIGTRIIYRFR